MPPASAAGSPLERMLFSSVLPKVPPALLSTTFGLRTILFPGVPLPGAAVDALRGGWRLADFEADDE